MDTHMPFGTILGLMLTTVNREISTKGGGRGRVRGNRCQVTGVRRSRKDGFFFVFAPDSCLVRGAGR